jgi:hypothetical protein
MKPFVAGVVAGACAGILGGGAVAYAAVAGPLHSSLRGPAGVRGQTGLGGAPGPAGARGEPGAQGASGIPGSSGVNGGAPFLRSVVVASGRDCPLGTAPWNTVYALTSSALGSPGNMSSTTSLTLCEAG